MALHYASAVFEGERAYGGEIFKLTEHTERLFASAEMLDMKIPFSVAEIDEACRQTLDRQGLADAYVRPIAWRGSEMMGVSAQNTRINVAIAIWQWPAYFDPSQLDKGIRLDISDWRRPDPRTAPCKAKAVGLYMICTLSKHAAERKGYADALMLDWRGQVAECTGANIFFVKDGELHTPTPDCFLDGITRRTVIALARARQLKVNERVIMPEETGRLRAVLHRRHRRRGDAGGRDRPLQVRCRRHHPRPACRLSGRGAAQEGGGRVDDTICLFRRHGAPP